MALELRRKSKQYLKSQRVAIEDNSPLSEEFFGLNDFPKYFGEGKNSFRIRPRFGVLKPNTKIDIEVLDSNGNPIYWEIPTYKDDDKSRLISVWIYDVVDKRYNTPDGPCEVIILGTLPDNQKVRWSRRVDVVKNKKSVSEVVFREIPRGNVSASIETFSEIPQSEGSLSRTIQAGQFTYKKSLYGDDVSFEASTAIINREMVSGSLELDLSSTTLFPRLGGGQSQPTRVTASITEVISNQIFRVSLPITSSDNRSEGSIHTYEYSDGNVSGEIKYLSTGSVNVTQNQVAIANITLSNVNPVSGRVSSVNTLIKSQGLPNADFELIANTDIPNERDISYKVAIPTEQLNDPKTLKIQFLNKSGDVSTTETIIEDVVFEGGNVYIGGNQSIVTGSLFIANAIGSGLEIGGHSSGFMKSVGYEGQISASEGKGPGGFIIYSGSNALQMGADVLTGVGMQFVGDNDDRHLIFSTANGGVLDVKTDKFFIGNTNSQFISGSDSNIEISSSLFHLDPKNQLLIIGSDAIIEGGLSADRIFTPATIGGSPSNITNASSSITQDGFAKFVSASIAGFIVNTEEIKSSDESLRLKSNGQMTGSAILLGDKAGGNFVQFADSTLTVRGDLAVDQITTPATIGGSPSNLTNASASITSDGFAKFVSASIGGWDITTGSIEGGNLIMKPEGILQTKDYASGVKGWKISSELNGYAEFENVKIRGTLATTTFEKESVNAVGGQLYVANSTTISGSISSSLSSVTTDVTNSFATNQQVQQSHTEIFLDDYTSVTPSNQPTMSVSDVVTLQFVGENPNPDPSATFFTNGSDLVSATLTNLSFGVFTFGLNGGVEVGELGGGSINPTDNSGDNFIIHYSSASLSSSIDEVYTNVSPSASSFIVDNVTGFASGEILTMKKVTNTGFSTEYVKVDSAERISGGSESDLSGYLHVTRSYGSGTTGDSGSLGDIASTSQSYEEGQVIVSTGKIGSGFIRLNANPNDPSTPYMDIVERTGSGLYDIELKARLGDLSGLANTPMVFSKANPGFGLATDNVYLQGGIIATFGEIGGFGISANTISSSNNNLILRDNGQISGSTVLFDGGTIGGFDLSSTQINSSNNNLILKANGQITASAASIDGDIVTDNITATGGTIGGFDLTSSQINSTNDLLILKSNGHITASAALISGSNIQVDTPNFGITSDGEVSANSMTLTDASLADAFSFRFITINSSNVSSYMGTYSGSDGNVYCILDLSGENSVIDNTTQGASYVRLNVNPTYPIGSIIHPYLHNPDTNVTNRAIASTLTVESGISGVKIAIDAVGKSAGTGAKRIYSYDGSTELVDQSANSVSTIQYSYIDENGGSVFYNKSIDSLTQSGYTYPKVVSTNTGQQFTLGRNFFAWKLLGASEYDTFTVADGNFIIDSNAEVTSSTHVPRSSNAYDLGSTTRRWRTVYSINALNTSDRNEKKNISSSDLGLNFINSLNPVKYNWVWDNDDSPIHYGLIAQEVNEIASNENVAIVHKENDNWSMAYNELISPMIKAIQELSDEVNQLKLQLSQSQG
jgi:hypothetical protein